MTAPRHAENARVAARLLRNVVVTSRSRLARVVFGASLAALASIASSVVAGQAAGRLAKGASSVWWVAVLLAGLGAVEGATTAWHQLNAIRTSAAVVAGLRSRLVEAAHHLGDQLDAVADAQTLVALGLIDAEQLDIVIVLFGQFVAAGVASIATVVVAATISAALAGVFTVAVGASVALGAYWNNRLVDVSLRHSQASQRVTSLMTAVIDGQETIDGLGLAGSMRVRAQAECDRARGAALDFARALAWSDSSGRLVGATAFGGLVGLVAASTTAVRWPIGDTVTAIALLGTLVPQTAMVALAIGRVASARAATIRLAGVIGGSAASSSAPGARQPASERSDLAEPPLEVELVGVTVVPGRDCAVLTGIDLEIPRGTLTVVCGGGGSGKSALLDVVRGALAPTAGRVRVRGVDPWSLGHERAAVVTSAEQHPFLFDESLTENLDIARPTTERFDESLWLAAAESLPSDIGDRRLGAAGSAVSGGQRRRFVVARSLAAPAPLVVLDDPSGGLDPLTERTMAERIASRVDERTILVASNSGVFAAAADLVVMLEHGRIVDRGTDRDLRSRSQRYRDLVPRPGDRPA